jgi:hypothetical protein
MKSFEFLLERSPSKEFFWIFVKAVEKWWDDDNHDEFDWHNTHEGLADSILKKGVKEMGGFSLIPELIWALRDYSKVYKAGKSSEALRFETRYGLREASIGLLRWLEAAMLFYENGSKTRQKQENDTRTCQENDDRTRVLRVFSEIMTRHEANWTKKQP